MSTRASRNAGAPSRATRSIARDRSSPPANTSSISARSRSAGDTLFDTDVGSFLRLGWSSREPTSEPFYTAGRTRPQPLHAGAIGGHPRHRSGRRRGWPRRRLAHPSNNLRSGGMWRWCPACRCPVGSGRRRLPYRRIAAAAFLLGSRAVPRAVCPKPQAPEAQRRCPLASVSSRTQVTPQSSGGPSPHRHLRCCARPDDPHAHPLLGISGIAPVIRVGSITDRTPRYRRFGESREESVTMYRNRCHDQNR